MPVRDCVAGRCQPGRKGAGKGAELGCGAGAGRVGVVWVGRPAGKPEVYNLDFRKLSEILDSAFLFAVL